MLLSFYLSYTCLRYKLRLSALSQFLLLLPAIFLSSVYPHILLFRLVMISLPFPFVVGCLLTFLFTACSLLISSFPFYPALSNHLSFTPYFLPSFPFPFIHPLPILSFLSSSLSPIRISCNLFTFHQLSSDLLGLLSCCLSALSALLISSFPIMLYFQLSPLRFSTSNLSNLLLLFRIYQPPLLPSLLYSSSSSLTLSSPSSGTFPTAVPSYQLSSCEYEV
jgi:hypothetical protein